MPDMDYAEAIEMKDSAKECQQFCQERNNCAAFTWKSNKSCWLKISIGERNVLNGAISGRKYCEKEGLMIIFLRLSKSCKIYVSR